MGIDTSRLADEVIKDLCADAVPALERFRLHDALTQWEFELGLDCEKNGFNEARLAEAIVDRPDNYPEPIPERIAALSEAYGYDDDYDY